MNGTIDTHIAKTGTTIVAIVCKDGAIIAADRRVTAGNIVVNKDTEKAVKVTDYLAMAVCGSASDAFVSRKVIAAELKLKELKTKSRPTVREAANFISMMYYRNIRSPAMIPHIVGALVGGYNEDGTYEVYTIEPAGGVAVKVTDYDANFGSGMPFVLGYLERQWRPDLTVKEGAHLAIESIKASTQRDTASGNGIDVYTITKNAIEHTIAQKIAPNYT